MWFALCVLVVAGVSFAEGQALSAQDFQCLSGFAALNFSSSAFDRYNELFDNESFITLAPAGKYTGPSAIEEYVKFASPFSDFVDDLQFLATEEGYDGIDNDGHCVFYIHAKNNYTLNPLASQDSITLALLLKVLFNPSKGKVDEWYVYYTPAFLKSFFSAVDTDAVASYVCETMRDNCTAEWSVNAYSTIEDCLADYNSLPLLDGEFHFDGKSKGCRILHSSFVGRNPAHCPHISYAPVVDAYGLTKCQTSAGYQFSDHFSEAELDRFNTFMVNNEIPTGVLPENKFVMVSGCAGIASALAFFLVVVTSI